MIILKLGKFKKIEKDNKMLFKLNEENLNKIDKINKD